MGMPVLEGIWAEALRFHVVAPVLRFARAPFHVAATGGGGGGGDGGGGHPGWTVPGDGRLVAISILGLNRGAHHAAADTFVPTRFVPPHGRRWRAAEQERELYGFAWGAHVCIGRR
eukprot:TRINITY_DN5704_c0_g2_i1.p5 TRINITY_DN5704_c0_g2~~TRINITY_DN5704_c0_g2_i1.p5  ORF type:complete len:116 (-),score=43.75 TRINITY_DN5704_c0_g2_i1:27-374(-)